MGKVETAHPRFDRTPPEFVGVLQRGLSGAGDVIAQSLCVVVRQFLVLIVHVRNPPYLRTSTRASSVPFPKSAQILPAIFGGCSEGLKAEATSPAPPSVANTRTSPSLRARRAGRRCGRL